MDMENILYTDYAGIPNIDVDLLVVSAWDKYIESSEEEENKIYPNDRDFFENNFKNPYDAAQAVSLSGNWWWADRFVYFDSDGYITSFCHWDDEDSPIVMDKIDINNLIQILDRRHN